MPGVNSQAVAEMSLALMLAVLRRVTYFDPLVRRGEGWRPRLEVLDTVGEISGRTVGLFGYGGVARRLAAVLTALGAEVIYTARREPPDAIGRRVGFDELLARADILSLHAPLTEETRGIVSRDALMRMKPGSVLINTARGELVDQPALAQVLRDGPLAGAGLDVFAGEPIDPADPLLGLDNVVLAPHVAWLTPETLGRSLAAAFENCRRLAAGEPLRDRVV
jgi:phosphoglycerate dehydrogenase-like enzyme